VVRPAANNRTIKLRYVTFQQAPFTSSTLHRSNDTSTDQYSYSATMARPRSPFEGSPSPPPQPLTKRDIRRNRIVERLQTMVDTFAANQSQHYRAQLQAVQVDMTLILRADPYTQIGDDAAGNGGMLDDAGEDIRREVDAIAAQVPSDEAAQRDYYALAGSRYREFVRQVNDGVEKRDAGLTALHVSTVTRLQQYERG